jgi:hypothetical protein
VLSSADKEIGKKLQTFELLSFLPALPSVGGICFHFTSVQIPFLAALPVNWDA